MTPSTPVLRIGLVLHPFAMQPVGQDHASQLATELLGQGHDVRGFGTRRGRDLPGAAPGAGEERITPLDTGAVEEFGPDVLIAYDARSPAALFAARQARRIGCPLVLVEDGHGLRGSLLERLLRGIGLRLWGRLVRREVDLVVALDPVARAELLADGYAPERIHVIPPGVDLGHFRPGLSSHLVGRHGLRGRLLLHCGPLEPGLGLDVLVEAFGRSVGKRGDWTLVLAGDGPELGRLRATASRCGIGSQLRHIPTPRPEELPGLLGVSTLAAATSDSDTRFARRAMACGLPVLAADLPRLRPLVEPDGAGLLAASGDSEAWAAMILSAAQAPERRRRWGQRGRQLAEEGFAWSHVARRCEQLLLEAHRQRSRVAGELQQAEALPPAP